MDLFWAIAAIIFGVLAMLLAVFGVQELYDDDTKYAKILFLVSIIFLISTIISIYKCASISKNKQHIIVVSTATLPQIDTTISYSQNKIDTIYTYHFIDMERIVIERE